MRVKEYDVRICTYKTGKGDMKVISFADDLEVLVDSERIMPQGKGSKLYFKPDSRGFKLNDRGSLQIQNRDWVRSLKKFEGQYGLMYDSQLKLYYVDQELATSLETTKAYGTKLGEKRNNYKKHSGPKNVTPAPIPESKPIVTVKKPLKELSNTKEVKPDAQESKEVKSQGSVVVKALLDYALLCAIQKDYDNVISALSELKTIIKEEK